MRLASWNVNSIRARMPRVLDYLQRERPDVVCLQETKVKDEAFPLEELVALGYTCNIFGQAAYNGVAILTQGPATDVVCGFDDKDDPDPQARLIAVTYKKARIFSAYVPNGSEIDSPGFAYKIAFYERLRQKLKSAASATTPTVIAGDFNVAPRPSDVHDPEYLADSVLFHPRMRTCLSELMDIGLTDIYAKHHPAGGEYSWWDYRALNFARNRGLRIDLILANEALSCRSTGASIARQERKGEKPSDHVPVVASFSYP